MVILVLFWYGIRKLNLFINFYFYSVINVQAKEKVKSRPVALKTVELMRVASAGLGMGPHHAMQVCLTFLVTSIHLFCGVDEFNNHKKHDTTTT